MVGVSLTIALFLVLERKSSLLKCFAVLLLGFFSVTRNSHAEILPVFPGEILPLQGKRLEQNRVMSYEAPPKPGAFAILSHLENDANQGGNADEHDGVQFLGFLAHIGA